VTCKLKCFEFEIRQNINITRYKYTDINQVINWSINVVVFHYFQLFQPV